MKLMRNGRFNKIDLNLLIVFTMVMRERSTTAAARRLCISQSAVSQSLRRLRKIAGDQLFIRDRRGVIPTPRALALYHDLAPPLIAINRALANKDEFDPSTSRRTFRIRIVSLQGSTVMPEITRRVHDLAPHVQIEVTVRGTYETTHRLLSNTLGFLDRHEFDLVIGPVVKSLQTWHRTQICPPVPMLCLYDGKRLKIGSPISLDEYLSLPQVVPYYTAHAKTIVDEGLEAVGHTRKFCVFTDDPTSIPLYLKRTNTIANFPKHAARLFAKTFGLTLSPLPFATLPFDKAIFWHVKDEQDPGHLWLRQIVREVMDELT